MSELVIKILKSLAVSSFIVVVFSIVYFGLRKLKVIVLSDDKSNFDKFFKKLIVFGSILLIGSLAFLIQKNLSDSNIKVNERAKRIENSYILEKDSTFLIGKLQVLVPSQFRVSPAGMDENKSEMYLFTLDTADKSLGFIVYYKYSNDRKASFESFVSEMTGKMTGSYEYEFKFSENSDLGCDYKPCLIQDYVRFDKSQNRMTGTFIFWKKYNDFYFVNFYNVGDNVEFYEKTKTNLYYNLIFK